MATVSFTAINSMIKNQVSVSMTDVIIHLWIYESAILLPKNVAIIFTCSYYLLIIVSGICSMVNFGTRLTHAQENSQFKHDYGRSHPLVKKDHAPPII